MVDVKAQRHEDIVKNFLSRFSSMSAIDVACGYGRFSCCFENYIGIDFCKEFIDIAQRNNPNKRFFCVDAHSEVDLFQADIVFSVISLSSLDMTPQEFNQRWKDNARFAVMVFELDTFYIFPKL